jgi:hypothetical protein
MSVKTFLGISWIWGMVIVFLLAIIFMFSAARLIGTGLVSSVAAIFLLTICLVLIGYGTSIGITERWDSWEIVNYKSIVNFLS